MLSPEISDAIRRIVILLPPVLMAVSFHELAHGYVAYLLGDPTAKNAGRLTLNPLAHLDVIGTLAFVVTQMIGWAKPVPVDPRYFKNPRTGHMLVAVAGPAANILMALVAALVINTRAAWIAFVPLSLHEPLVIPLLKMTLAAVQINLALCLFNLLPVPPLDGSAILAGLLPRDLAARYESLGRYGFFVLLLLAVTGGLAWFLGPVVHAMVDLLVA